MTETPEPGLYENVPFASYLSWDAVSASRIKLAVKSMAHYDAGFVGEETPAMRFGSLCHTGKLEPLSLAERYVVMPPYHLDAENKTKSGEQTQSKATSYYKMKKREFESIHEHQTIVEQAEFDAVKGIVSALAANSGAKRALSGIVEVSLVWRDRNTGLLCKCRADALNTDAKILGDLKTTDDCTYFESTIRKYQYHVQMAHYCSGVEHVLGINVEPWLVPVERARPYGNMAAPIDPKTLDLGHRITRKRLERIAECKRENNWPGYTSPASWIVNEVSKPVEVTVGGKTATI